MVSLIISFLLALTPFAQDVKAPAYDIRAKQNLLLGKGEKSGADYWDVVITRQPGSGILIKLPYTKKGGKFTFDLHHRVAMTGDFGLPAEIMTVIEVLNGGTTTVGVYTLADMINPGDQFEEQILKVSAAEIDRYVTPMSRKTITLNTRPGPQSISIVGQTLTITRGTSTTRIDTPGTRIATVSNLKFEEVTENNPLKKSTGN
jgi:archaellum component FlaF (FlaF/FlaG flagellin family)